MYVCVCAFAVVNTSKSTSVCVCVMQLPIGSRCCFCHKFNPGTIEAIFLSVGLHPSTPPYHHTPWGLVCWQSNQITVMATSGYDSWSTRHGSMAICTAKAPSCHSPWAVRHGHGQSFVESLSAFEIGPRQYPGSCPMPFMGKETRSVCVCTCVRGCVRAWVRALVGACVRGWHCMMYTQPHTHTHTHTHLLQSPCPNKGVGQDPGSSLGLVS